MTGVDVGVIEGGWGFVIAAYTLTATVLGAYVISIIARHSAEAARAERDAKRDREVGA